MCLEQISPLAQAEKKPPDSSGGLLFAVAAGQVVRDQKVIGTAEWIIQTLNLKQAFSTSVLSPSMTFTMWTSSG